MNEPVRVVIVGAGHRSLLYASYAKQHPEEMQIAGVVEPDAERRALVAKQYDLPPERCFADVNELVKAERFADAAINGTMDELHVETTIPLLHAGYDVLLEKPIGVHEAEVLELQRVAKSLGRNVMICHVLRYAPFYRAIKEKLEEGAIGEILTMETAEHVGYDHMAVSFIRGKWNSQEKCKSSMLMQKCCHDLDIIAWLNESAEPVKVSSFGSLMYFRPERAPAGSGTRCLTDCQIEASCPYSARLNYIEQGRWGFYVWPNEHLGVQWTEEEKLESLRTDNPYGRCVWRCDNDVVDHQTVHIEFDNGSTASHVMVGGAARACRTIHLIGTEGELYGVLEDGEFVIRRPSLEKGRLYTEEKVRAGTQDDSHGGGDLLLVQDFVRIMRGEAPSISYTALDRSITGHRIGFQAEAARLDGTVHHFR